MNRENQQPRRVIARWAATPAGKPRRHLAKQAIIALAALAVVIVGARLALPFFIERYVNDKLGGMKDYRGSIGKVRVHLWRGAYAIHDIKILKSGGTVPAPLFAAPVVDLSIQWKELFHGAVVGKVLVKRPEITFVEGKTGTDSQSGSGQPWAETLGSLFPFTLNRFEIREGQVRFRNFQKSRTVNVYVTNLWAVATNLSNSRDLPQRLPAGLHATGQTLGQGIFVVDARLAPREPAPTFEVNASVTNINLVDLNDFLRAYAKLDVERGRLSVFASIALDEGRAGGYVKVLCNNLEVFAWDKERKKNVLAMVWQAIAGVLAAGFKNHPHDQLAAIIPVSGTFDKAHFHTWAAVGSALKNAFVKALLPRVEPFVHVEDIDKGKQASADGR